MSLQKKLEQAYTKGSNDMYDIWIKVIDRTPGIGPVLKKRIANRCASNGARNEDKEC